MTGIPKTWRRASVAVLCLVGVLLSVPHVSGQIGGEGYATLVHGTGETRARLTGFVGGGGVLIRNRFGLDAEIGLSGDNSDERVVVPLLAVGGNLRLAVRRRIVPFVATGFTRIGDLGGWHAGGGVNVAISPRSAVRVELRGAVPVADFGSCVPNARTECALSSDPWWFLRVGWVFGFAR